MLLYFLGALTFVIAITVAIYYWAIYFEYGLIIIAVITGLTVTVIYFLNKTSLKRDKK